MICLGKIGVAKCDGVKTTGFAIGSLADVDSHVFLYETKGNGDPTANCVIVPRNPADALALVGLILRHTVGEHTFGAAAVAKLRDVLTNADRMDCGDINGPGVVEAIMAALAADDPAFDKAAFEEAIGPYAEED